MVGISEIGNQYFEDRHEIKEEYPAFAEKQFLDEQNPI